MYQTQMDRGPPHTGQICSLLTLQRANTRKISLYWNKNRLGILDVANIPHCQIAVEDDFFFHLAWNIYESTQLKVAATIKGKIELIIDR